MSRTPLSSLISVYLNNASFDTQDLEKEAAIRESDEVPMEEILELRRDADAQLTEEQKRAKNTMLGDDGSY